MWFDGVVPIAVKSILEQMETSPIFVSDFEARGIGLAILDSGHRLALLGHSMRNEFQLHFQGSKRFGTPIDGNEGEKPMFDLVPCAGRWWIMGHRDRVAFLIGQML